MLTFAFSLAIGGCFQDPKGTVKISSEPANLQVFIDGSLKGSTPLRDGEYLEVRLAEGNHNFEVTKPIDDFEEYYTSTNTFVAPDTTQTLHITLESLRRLSSEGNRNRTRYFVSCSKGQVEKCVQLAKHYSRGTRNSSDLTLANDLHGKACLLNHWASCYTLSKNYSDGIGTEKNPDKAKTLGMTACNADYFPACNHVGNSLDKESKFTESRSLYQKSCDGGNIEGCTELGVSYLRNGEDQNKDTAMELFALSCGKGEGRACAALASFADDTKEKITLLEKSCQYNYQKGCQELKAVKLAEKRRLEAKRKEDMRKRAAAAEAERRRRRQIKAKIGTRFFYSYGRGSGYTGVVQGMSGDEHFRVKVVDVDCPRFLCMQLNASTCTGNEDLSLSITSKWITIPVWCVN